MVDKVVDKEVDKVVDKEVDKEPHRILGALSKAVKEKNKEMGSRDHVQLSTLVGALATTVIAASVLNTEQ